MTTSSFLLITLSASLGIMALVVVYMYTVIIRQQQALVEMQRSLEEAGKDNRDDILITRTPKHDIEMPRI